MSTEDAIFKKSKSLAKLTSEYNKEVTEFFLIKIISDLAQQFNIGKNMSMEQMAGCAKIICKEYYYLNPHEIKRVLHNAVMGMYGKVYDRLDPPTILEWFSEYSKEREEIAITKQEVDNSNYKGNSYVADTYKEMKALYEKVKDNTESDKGEKEKSEEYRKQEILMKAVNEFNELWLKQNPKGDMLEDKRYIQVDGKSMLMEEFMQYRLENEL